MGKETLNVKQSAEPELPSIMALYQCDIMKICPLTNGQIKALGLAIEQGRIAEKQLTEGVNLDSAEINRLTQTINVQRQAATELTSRFVFLAIGIAYQYRGTGVPIEDLVQRGNEGLMKAALRYTPAHGSFKSYARTAIQHEITDEIRESKLIVPCQDVTSKAENLVYIALKLYDKSRRLPTIEELAEVTNMDADNPRQNTYLKRAINFAVNLIHAKNPISTNKPVEILDSDETIQDFLPDHKQITDQKVFNHLRRKTIEQILSGLTDMNLSHDLTVGVSAYSNPMRVCPESFLP